MDSSFHVFMNILVTGFSLVVIGFHIMVTRVDYFYLNCNDDIVGNYCQEVSNYLSVKGVTQMQ